MSLLIDIHCHLDHPLFKDKTDGIINNAGKAGLKIILTAGINPETNRKTLQIAEKYDIVKASLGIYPIKTLQKEIETGNYPLKPNIFDIDEEISFIEKNKNKIKAVGECGLDYSQNENPTEQKKLFEKLISLAEKIKKPIIVHSRKAELDCVEILETSKLKKIIMHCFSGKKSLVKRINDNGWFLTIPTNVVRSHQFQFIADYVPITQLFCETDAPYLSPFKDARNLPEQISASLGNFKKFPIEKTNEPAFVIEAYKKLAEIKKMDLNEVINNIWMNWQKMF